MLLVHVAFWRAAAHDPGTLRPGRPSGDAGTERLFQFRTVRPNAAAGIRDVAYWTTGEQESRAESRPAFGVRRGRRGESRWLNALLFPASVPLGNGPFSRCFGPFWLDCTRHVPMIVTAELAGDTALSVQGGVFRCTDQWGSVSEIGHLLFLLRQRCDGSGRSTRSD